MKSNKVINPWEFMGVTVGYNAFDLIDCPKLLGIYSYVTFVYARLDRKYASKEEIMDEIKIKTMMKFKVSLKTVNRYFDEISKLKIINLSLIDF